MKGKHIPLLILPVFLFLFLFSNPLGVKGAVEENGNGSEQEIKGEWRNSGECVAECGTTSGMKEQTWYEWTCEEECPTRTFEDSQKGCKCGYEEYGDEDKCRKWSYFYWKYAEKITTNSFGPINVVYSLESSEDGNMCVRPSAETLEIPEWAVAAFNADENLPEYIEPTLVNCDFVATEVTQEIECDDAELVACPVVEEEVKEKPKVVEETKVVEDEPEVLGTEDKAPEKVAEVAVVLAETGSTNNMFVYVVQAILTVSTILSGIFFSKKYIM